MNNPKIYTGSAQTKEGWKDRFHFFAESDEQARKIAESRARHAFGDNFDKIIDVTPPPQMPDDPKVATCFGIESFAEHTGFCLTFGRKNGAVEFSVAGSPKQLQHEEGFNDEGHHYENYYFKGNCDEPEYLRKIAILLLELADDVDTFNRRHSKQSYETKTI